MEIIRIMNLVIASNTTCETSKVACPNGRCINRNWLCDKEDDCGDNWDENTYNCAHKSTATTRRPTCKCIV